jgi:hypothetical protein
MALFHAKCSVAVLGYSENHLRASHKIALYLKSEGNEVIGVNPKWSDCSCLPVVPSLQALPKPVDIIQVFRNRNLLMSVAEDILALSWRPKLVWCQQGIYDFSFMDRLEEEGIPVVMDACPYALRTYL